MNQKPDNKEKKELEKQIGADRKAVKYATIPVTEEKLEVGKEKVESGKVHISKKVYEEEEIVDVATQRDKLSIERVAVNKIIDSPPPAIRHEGDKTIIPVFEEVTVVEKRLLLVEEVHISKRTKEEHTQQKIKLRKEEVIVDRSKSDSTNEEEV